MHDDLKNIESILEKNKIVYDTNLDVSRTWSNHVTVVIAVYLDAQSRMDVYSNMALKPDAIFIISKHGNVMIDVGELTWEKKMKLDAILNEASKRGVTVNRVRI